MKSYIRVSAVEAQKITFFLARATEYYKQNIRETEQEGESDIRNFVLDELGKCVREIDKITDHLQTIYD